MPRTRKPSALSNFPSVYEDIVHQTIKHGSLPMDLRTEQEATSSMFSLYRYFESVKFYQPDSALASQVRRIGIRRNGQILELVDKEVTIAADIMRQAIADREAGTTAVSVDPAAKTLGELYNDPEYLELKRTQE